MKTCEECKQQCCKSVIVEIDEPETWEDWEFIRWKVAHKNVRVILDNDDDWCIEFLTDCEQMLPDGRCKIYDKRPKICRTHEPESCVVNGEGEYYKIVFDKIEDVEKYLKEHPDAIGEETEEVHTCPNCNTEFTDSDEKDYDDEEDSNDSESSPDDDSDIDTLSDDRKGNPDD